MSNPTAPPDPATSRSSSPGEQVTDAAAAIAELDRLRATVGASTESAVINGRVALQALLDLDRAGHITHSEFVSRISEAEHVPMVIRDLLAVARREVINLVPGGPLPLATLAAAAEEDLRAMARLPIRTIYTAELARDPDNRLFLESYARTGADVRVADDLPHRLVVVDRACAVLPLHPGHTEAGALVVREPGMVASLCALFAAIWHRAVPLALFDPDQHAELERGDRDVLLLMSSGVTDEVAAGRMGISVRTYRRTVASLLRRLGAESRFQAGVRAVERGWI